VIACDITSETEKSALTNRFITTTANFDGVEIPFVLFYGVQKNQIDVKHSTSNND
jgi:hypothetical protein